MKMRLFLNIQKSISVSDPVEMRFSLLPETLKRVQHSPTVHSERGRVNPVPKYYKTKSIIRNERTDVWRKRWNANSGLRWWKKVKLSQKYGKANALHESCNLEKQINYVVGKTFGRRSAWRVCVRATDLFDALPPAAYKRPAFRPQICKAPWPLYTSAGISLCETPDGRLQLLAL